ncbi:hypothetical protein NCAS_0E02180 [Naumovozyma castellii]|uniref:Cyclin-like domain-containing protein n=1 Tax=Naumovozyma castellii TaxID=27288 RepID=G0VFM1_NAUCA|nr:hypothetical protein NCAS_0E02180 [Naumovozyma castellii CBS 4309]CCC70288.1 hypothetical protein NCAS_0E02180 [Naumovozyma castellii CBS 4309]
MIRTSVTHPNFPPVNLLKLSQARSNRSKLKNQNKNLLKSELANHQASINEYSKDLWKRSMSLELSENYKINKPKLASFQLQPEINEKMRTLIFDFIMCCHTRLKLSTPSLFLTFNIIDRFSSKFLIKNFTYQLISLTALWISSKYWDLKTYIPTLRVLQQLCCNQYSISQFKEMELHILKSLDWSVCQVATHDSIIDIVLFLNQRNVIHNEYVSINEIKIGAIMLCELASFNIDLAFNYDPSITSITAINLIKSALIFKRSNTWEDIHSFATDPQMIKITEALLTQLSAAYNKQDSEGEIINSSSLPSSFNSKYNLQLDDNKTNDNSSTSRTAFFKTLFDALYNYSIQWQMNQFYSSSSVQEYLTSVLNTGVATPISQENPCDATTTAEDIPPYLYPTQQLATPSREPSHFISGSSVIKQPLTPITPSMTKNKYNRFSQKRSITTIMEDPHPSGMKKRSTSTSRS